MISQIKLYPSFFCALGIWAIMQLSGWSELFFTVEPNAVMRKLNVLQLFFLFLLIAPLFDMLRNRKSEVVRHQFYITCTYLCITLTILLVIWPGAYAWDDIWVIAAVQGGGLEPWQHFFTGVFDNLCVQTIPVATGVQLIQIYIFSLVSGYCVSRIARLTKLKKTGIVIAECLLMLAMLMPPVLLYSCSGFRISMCCHLELLLITKLFLCYTSDEKLTFDDIAMVTALVVVVATWRTEGVYYLGCFAVVLFWFGSWKLNRAVAVGCIVFAICVVFACGRYNDYLVGNNYSITGTFLQINSAVKSADLEKDADLLSQIDMVIDVNIVMESSSNAETLYWDNVLVRTDHTEEDVAQYMSAVMRLCLRYPGAFLKVCWENFLASAGCSINNGVSSQRNLTNDALILPTREPWQSVQTALKEPFNVSLREEVLRTIGCYDEEGRVTPGYYVFWNLCIPLALMGIAFVRSIIKREWFLCFVMLAVLGRVPLVFLTSPAPYLMYYLPVYLISYILGIACLFDISLKVPRTGVAF